MRPNHRRTWMPREHIEHLRVIDRQRRAFGERHVDVIVKNDRKSGPAGEIENSVQRRIWEGRYLAGHLARYELFVNAEFADAAEHAWVHFQHTRDVIDRVHVRRIEPGNHRIQAGAILGRQREIFVRDDRVGEGVIIKRSVGLQVIGRRKIARIRIGPGLLKRDPNKVDRFTVEPIIFTYSRALGPF